MTILDYFPYPTPRLGQLKVLKWVEDNWNRYDVMVLQAPVAAGKSCLAVTIARWAYEVHGIDCGITTPDNVLVNQYKSEFNLLTLPLRRSFASGDLYTNAKEAFKVAPLKLMNNHTLLSSRAYSRLQIMDEAHELIPMLQDMEGVKVWKHLVGYPDRLRTVADVLLWAASRKDKLGDKIAKTLTRNPEDYTIDQGVDFYRGNLRDYLRIYPLTPKHNRPILWPPSKVKKMIMMSATIGLPDIEDLGLTRRRVGFIEVPSDIPAARRPVYYKGVGSMGRHSSRDTIRRLAEKLDELGPRCFVHSTYGVASKLPDSPRRIKHTRHDKQQLLRRWMQGEDERQFVGCGLTTGLDLKGPNFPKQAICKVQFPDLGDPAVMAKSIRTPDWYAWATIKTLVQAYGRICRGEEDYGETFLLDSDFAMLYSRYSHLFPEFFREALEL